MKKQRILSLDGGGSWALLQSMTLKAIYQDTPVGTRCGDILKQFDLIVANSGGALMLAAMIEFINEDMDFITNIFLNDESRGKVFSPLKWYEKNGLEHIASLLQFGPQYKASRKYTGLASILEKTSQIPMWRLKEIRPEIPANIVICSFDYDRNRASFFRTNQSSKSQSPNPRQYEYTLAHAVHAASNAPVMFFDEPARFKIGGAYHQLWDGAVGGNNNPVLIGITEALAELGDVERSAESLQVLSIGTANNMLPVRGFTNINESEHPDLLKEIEKASFKGAIKKMATSITSEPPDAANYMAHMFLGGKPTVAAKPAIVRMNPLLKPEISGDGKKWIFPSLLNKNDHKDFVDLINLEMDATENKEVLQIQKLGNWWIDGKVANQPIRLDSSDLSCNIGHPTFREAKAEWLKISQKNPTNALA